MPDKPITCPLRKPCAICKKPYGRKIRLTGTSAGYLESVSSWLKGEVCGDDCRGILRLWTQYVRAERKEKMDSAEDSAKYHAIHQFLYQI